MADIFYHQASSQKLQRRTAASPMRRFRDQAKKTIIVGASFIQQFCRLLLNASLRLTLEIERTHPIVLYLFSFFFLFLNFCSQTRDLFEKKLAFG